MRNIDEFTNNKIYELVHKSLDEENHNFCLNELIPDEPKKKKKKGKKEEEPIEEEEKSGKKKQVR